MFSYFSSSNVDGAIDDSKSSEGVTAIGTSATERSNISDDVIGYKSAIREVVNESPPRYLSAPISAASWNQAHDMYCSKHGTLKATIRQILSEICEENQEIPWELPSRSDENVLVEAKDVANILQTKRLNNSRNTIGTPVKASISSLLMSPLKMVSAVASIMRDPDDDVDEWVQDDDDAFIDDAYNCGGELSSSSSSDFGLNTPIINLDITEAAVECIERNMDQIPPEVPLVMGLTEWNNWACSSFSNHSTFNKFKLSVYDHDFLLQVLVDLNRARIIQRANSEPKGLDVIVLTSKTIETEKDDSIPENLRIAISIWDIQKAEENIEQKLQEWSEQAAECTKKALMYKKRNQMKIAATQLAKRRLIQQRMDSDSRLQIQLLQTKNAIESAQSNRSMIDLMADSAKMLRQLREETPLEEVDEAIDDLHSEIDGLQDINDMIASVGNNVTNACTEDELLEELQNLTISDNVPVTSMADSSIITTSQNEDKETSKGGLDAASAKVEVDSISVPEKKPELA